MGDQSAEAAKGNFYGGSNFDWDNYADVRPAYPQKLFDLIFEYHGEGGVHRPSWDLAVDFGTGPGVIVPPLLSRFQKVVGSDLNETQIGIARQSLIPQYGSKRLELHVGPAEKCDWVKEGTADIVTAATAIHWFDNQKWIEQAARLLKPGGTLAFWLYTTPKITTLPEESVQRSLQNLEKLLMEASFTIPHFPAGAIAPILSRLQSVEVDDTNFEKEERHFWPFNEEIDRYLFDVRAVEHRSGPIQMKIGKDAKVINHALEPGKGQCGAQGVGHILERGPWRFNDIRRFRQSLGEADSSYLNTPEIVDAKKQLQEAVGGDDVTFHVAFPLAMVLAKRR